MDLLLDGRVPGSPGGGCADRPVTLERLTLAVCVLVIVVLAVVFFRL